MPPFWILLELRLTEMVVTTGAGDVQSSSKIITTNKPTHSFLQAGCPSCHPTTSVKELKGEESITFHGIAHPKLTWGLLPLS